MWGLYGGYRGDILGIFQGHIGDIQGISAGQNEKLPRKVIPPILMGCWVFLQGLTIWIPTLPPT